MAEKNKFYKIAFFITLAVLIISLFMFYLNKSSSVTNCPETREKECPQPKEKALLDASTNNWAINLYNSGEVIMSGRIFNYGDKEAKNIVIECGMYDGDENGYLKSDIPIFTTTKNIGNLASRDYKDFELTYSKTGTNDYSQSLCSVKSCDSCDILANRII